MSGVEGSSLRDQVLNINEVAAFGMTFIQPSTDLNIDYVWPCSDLDIGDSCIHRQLKLFMNIFFQKHYPFIHNMYNSNRISNFKKQLW